MAIWDLSTGQLQHFFDVPRGLVADNADFAFSQDGRFAFSSGSEAKMWELASGRELNSWPLPPGLADTLAFHASGKLLLFRLETLTGKPPYSNFPFTEHPRVCRIRDLLGLEPAKPLGNEITEYNKAVFGATVSPDGSFFVVQGSHEGPDGARRTVKRFDALTGQEVWSIVIRAELGSGWVSLDPSGAVVGFLSEYKTGKMTLVEAASGRFVRTLEGTATLGRGARRWASPLGSGYGLSLPLFQHDRDDPLVILGIDTPASYMPRFSPDGNLVAWGNPDGWVSVCDLNEIQRRLAEHGLGW